MNDERRPGRGAESSDGDRPESKTRPARRKRLSADLPQHWLHDPAYWALTDRAWRLCTHALMWAIGRTDGFIPESMLSMLLAAESAERDVAIKELAAAGLWERAPGGWQIVGWGQSQSTVAEIENNRAADRKRQARHRAKAGDSHAVSHAVTNGMSTERHGTARHGTDGERSSDASQAQKCIGPDCTKPARRGCRTCWEHVELESTP